MFHVCVKAGRDVGDYETFHSAIHIAHSEARACHGWVDVYSMLPDGRRCLPVAEVSRDDVRICGSRED